MNTPVASLPAKWRKEATQYGLPAQAVMLTQCADELEAALASPAPSAGVGVGVEARARELLAAEYARGGMDDVVAILRRGNVPEGWVDDCIALRAIVAALQHPAAPSVSPAVEGGLPILPDLPKCLSGSPVTVTWAEDGETTTREVWSDTQVVRFARDYGERCFDAGRRLATPEQPGSAVQGEVTLPCDVRLPPATTICAGVKLSTLIGAMERRREWGVVNFPTPAPAAEQGDDSTIIAESLRAYASNLELRATQYRNKGEDAIAQTFADRRERTLALIGQPEARGVEGAIGMLCETMALLRYDGGLRDGDFANRIEQAVNLLKTATPNPVRAEQPEGKGAWKLVPVVPTDEMCDAAMAKIKAITRVIEDGPAKGATLVPDPHYHAYVAMVAAAPGAGVGVDGEWFADVRRCLEDVSTEMRARGRGDERFQRLIQRMPAALAGKDGAK